MTAANVTNLISLQQMYHHSYQIADYPVHPLIQLETHIVFLKVNFDIRILTLILILNKMRCENSD